VHLEAVILDWTAPVGTFKAYTLRKWCSLLLGDQGNESTRTFHSETQVDCRRKDHDVATHCREPLRTSSALMKKFYERKL